MFAEYVISIIEKIKLTTFYVIICFESSLKWTRFRADVLQVYRTVNGCNIDSLASGFDGIYPA